MMDRIETYDVVGSPKIDITSTAGDIVVKPGTTDQVKIVLSGYTETVENTLVEASADAVVVRSRAGNRSRRLFSRAMDITVTVPEGASLRVKSGSGDVRIRLGLDDVEVSSGSGDVRIDNEAGDVRVKIGSGRVVIAGAVRDATVTSVSGDVSIGYATDAVVKTASGTLVLGTVNGSARIKSASGDVKVREFRGSDLTISTMSGDTIIYLAPGRVVEARIKTLSGDFRNKVKPSSEEKTSKMSLDVKSFSGDVTLRTAG